MNELFAQMNYYSNSSHTDELFARTNILRIDDLNKYLLGIYAYKLARRDQVQTAKHSYNTTMYFMAS